jgi:hypothetical protein
MYVYIYIYQETKLGKCERIYQKKHAIENGEARYGYAEGTGDPTRHTKGIGEAEHTGADNGDDDVAEGLGGRGSTPRPAASFPSFRVQKGSMSI